MNLAVDELTLRFAARHDEAAAARHELSTWLETTRPNASAVEIGDAALILTEMVANAIDHSETEDVEVRARLGETLDIEVANDGPVSSVPAVAQWGVLEHGDRGRGLRILHALCTTIRIEGDRSHTRIRCSYPLS